MGETVGSVPGHFREVAISLHYLLNHEDFTDLTFLCSDGPVHCHKAMLLTHSPLLKYLFSISASRQASDTTVISLPQVEKIIMIKLLQYVYKGKASFKKDQDLGKLYELAEVLDFDMSFAKKDSEDDSPRQTVVTSKTKKKKDANKKKQTEVNEAAKEVPDEDLASALIRKFQGQAQNQDDPAPVNPVLEESPIIVTGKRKRVAQTLEEKKGKKYQYYTGNKVSRYQDGLDDDGVAAGQEKDSEDFGAMVNVIDGGSDEEGLAMDADVEECTKQRAALDKMKIGLKNCGSEENVKRKVIEILEGGKRVEPKDVEEKDGHAGASGSQEVTIDPIFSPKEISNTGVVENGEQSPGKRNQAPQVNLERKSPRSKKQEQMNESVEGVGDNQLKENAKGVSDKSVVNEKIHDGDVEINVDKRICPVTNDIGKAASSLGDLLEIDTSNEQGDLIEMDTSNELDDNGDQNLKEVTVRDTEIIEMPSNVEEQSKQKASLDNMKVNILNCAKEEHIKEKVEALMRDMGTVDSKQNDSEIGYLPSPTKSDTLDTEIFAEEIVKSPKKRGRPAKAVMSDIGKVDSKQNDSEIGDLPSPTKSDTLDIEIIDVEEIVKPPKKRLSRNKSSSFAKIPDTNGEHQAAINDATVAQEVSLVQCDEEVENPLEKEWEAKALRDKMKIKIHKLDKDPVVSKVYSKSKIQKMVQEVLQISDDEEVNAKKLKVVTDEGSPPDGSDEEDCDKMASPKKGKPVKSSPIKISSDIQLASRTQICAYCRRIFLSIEAFDNHIKEEHGHGEDDADDELDDIINADDSPSKKIIKKRIGSKVSKSESKRKNKVKSYSEETSDESDHSEDEDPFKKNGKKRIATKPKNSDDSSETDDNKEKKKKFKRKKSSSSEEMMNQSKNKTAKPTGSNAVENAISCYKCGIECKSKQELKNHILTHFYSELFVFLPASKPFTCPTCSALNRDRTSLVRHYAFTHKEIYKFCTEEQLNGGTSKGKRKSVNCESSSSKLDASEGAKSNGFSQSLDNESFGLSAKKNSADFDMAGTFTDSDDADLFASRKDTNYTVKSFDDLFNETENASKTKSVSNGGHDVSDPSDNMSEKFLGMDDNDPADVDDLLKESDDGELRIFAE